MAFVCTRKDRGRSNCGTRDRKRIRKIQHGRVGVLMIRRFERWCIFDKLVNRVAT